MKYINYLSIILIASSFGCKYGINEKTTQISYINNTCLQKDAWDSIKAKYSTKNIHDTIYLQALSDFKNVPFPVSVIYFDQEPKELVGVEYSVIRYVFNPKISDQILDGLSPELNNKEKKRLRNRVQQLLIPYQCEEGKEEAMVLMAK